MYQRLRWRWGGIAGLFRTGLGDLWTNAPSCFYCWPKASSLSPQARCGSSAGVFAGGSGAAAFGPTWRRGQHLWAWREGRAGLGSGTMHAVSFNQRLLVNYYLGVLTHVESKAHCCCLDWSSPRAGCDDPVCDVQRRNGARATTAADRTRGGSLSRRAGTGAALSRGGAARSDGTGAASRWDTAASHAPA